MASPSLSLSEAESLARSLFGICDVIGSSNLGSCEDANFRIKTASGLSYVLKVYNRKNRRDDIDFENNVIQCLCSSSLTEKFSIPTIIPCLASNGFIATADIDGEPHFIRMLTFVEGKVMSEFKYFSEDVLVGIGSFVATMHKALSSYSFTIVERVTFWDMRHAHSNIMSRLEYLHHDTSEFQFRLRSCSDAMQEIVLSHCDLLTKQVIHGDLAYYNLIGSLGENGRPAVTGVIDFGDSILSWVIGDIAIAITPLLVMDDFDIIVQVKDILQGYLVERTLTKEEVIVLWPLIVLRSILLYVTVSALLVKDPGNKYLQDEIVLNRKLLLKVLATPPYLVQAALLDIAKFTNQSSMVPVIMSCRDVIAEYTTHLELDFGVFSNFLNNGNWLTSPDTLHRSIFQYLVKQISDHDCPLLIPSGQAMFFLGSRPRDIEQKASIPLGSTLVLKPGTRLILPQKAFVVSKGHFSVDERDILFCRCRSAYRIVLKMEFSTILLEGSFEIEQGIDFDIATNQPFASILSSDIDFEIGLIYIQSLPDGYSPVQNDVTLNGISKYDNTYFPPKYCTPCQFMSWSLVCPPTLTSFGTSADTSSLEKRYAYFAKVQEHYFRMPPMIERGYMGFLYDINGRAYLDMVNNVAIVGHSHPSVVSAAFKQLQILNTNSRFVYSVLGYFCEKIISKIPTDIVQQGKLNRVFLVNSGSEATDLAMRLARSVVTERRRKALHLTGADDAKYSLNRDIICLEGAYHGVTTASDEVSTTLNDNPRALESRAPWIHLVPMPNLFRGKFRLPHNGRSSTPEEVGEVSKQYATLVEMKVKELTHSGRAPAAFISETLSGNAGGVELPAGYLKQVYESIRSVGGLCIADEVQVGYGRLGKHFWGFEEHDVVPDIVTMAKAAGNGHPLGFVITSEEIASEFGVDGSFFSSAGGGPVSCAVGMAVLETIEKESLQQNARIVGEYLQQKLLSLQEKYPHIIGAIHGHGLYQGIELISCRENSDDSVCPGTQIAYAICERLLNLGVICHNTGDYSNVLKVKPPMCFSVDDANFFIEALETALQT